MNKLTVTSKKLIHEYSIEQRLLLEMYNIDTHAMRTKFY